MRWERFGTDWIEMDFRSRMNNIFIVEKAKEGTALYCFDDGPEVPTERVTLKGDDEKKLRDGIEGLREQKADEQEICEFLFGYFPELREFCKWEYGRL
jgi:hypothetical protein